MQEQPLNDPTLVERVRVSLVRKYQHLLDKSTVYTRSRWGASAALLCLFALRVYLTNGWFIVAYGLGIYLLNLFIGFLSPQVDPETEGPVLPTREVEEFRPFVRRVPEFKFWYSATRGTVVALVMSFFQLFNVPVFWPILLFYFIALFVLTMKRQIKHMIKHKYVPWSAGKQRYDAKPTAAATAAKGKPAKQKD